MYSPIWPEEYPILGFERTSGSTSYEGPLTHNPLATVWSLNTVGFQK